MSEGLLPRRTPSDFLSKGRVGIPPEIRRDAEVIVERVRDGGEDALREYATRFGERDPEESLYVTRDELALHLDALDRPDRARLERIGERIRSFAEAQLGTLTGLDVQVPGGRIGHQIDPVGTAGCLRSRWALPTSVIGPHDRHHRTVGRGPIGLDRQPAPRSDHSRGRRRSRRRRGLGGRRGPTRSRAWHSASVRCRRATLSSARATCT